MDLTRRQLLEWLRTGVLATIGIGVVATLASEDAEAATKKKSSKKKTTKKKKKKKKKKNGEGTSTESTAQVTAPPGFTIGPNGEFIPQFPQSIVDFRGGNGGGGEPITGLPGGR